MKRITIAIDGYSSCGKSTIAKALASKLGYSYVDSGAMYRCTALYCLEKGVLSEQGIFVPEDIIACLPDIHLNFIFNPLTKSSESYLNGVNVEKQIREMRISKIVSKISTIKEVRAHMVNIQRELGRNKGVVMDGRDIGTRVFPHAELKIFMTADMEVRIQRRLYESTAKGQHVTYDEVKQNLEARDYDDTHRKESPLTKAKDAIVLDNSDLNKEQQLEFVVRLMQDMLLTKDEV